MQAHPEAFAADVQWSRSAIQEKRAVMADQAWFWCPVPPMRVSEPERHDTRGSQTLMEGGKLAWGQAAAAGDVWDWGIHIRSHWREGVQLLGLTTEAGLASGPTVAVSPSFVVAKQTQIQAVGGVSDRHKDGAWDATASVSALCLPCSSTSTVKQVVWGQEAARVVDVRSVRPDIRTAGTGQDACAMCLCVSAQ